MSEDGSTTVVSEEFEVNFIDQQVVRACDQRGQVENDIDRWICNVTRGTNVYTNTSPR